MQQAFGRRGQDRHPRPRYPPEDRRLACLIEAIATAKERDCAVRHAIGGLILSRRGFCVTAISRGLGQPLPTDGGGSQCAPLLILATQTVFLSR
jgi:hypothetical protein